MFILLGYKICWQNKYDLTIVEIYLCLVSFWNLVSNPGLLEPDEYPGEQLPGTQEQTNRNNSPVGLLREPLARYRQRRRSSRRSWWGRFCWGPSSCVCIVIVPLGKLLFCFRTALGLYRISLDIVSNPNFKRTIHSLHQIFLLNQHYRSDPKCCHWQFQPCPTL